MKKLNFPIVLAVIVLVASLIIPIVIQSEQMHNYILMLLIALLVVSGTLCLASYITVIFQRRRVKGIVYIAASSNNNEYLIAARNLLNSKRYVCYPNIHSIIKNSEVKSTTTENQILSSKVLVIILSNKTDNYYQAQVLKIYKKNRKRGHVLIFTTIESDLQSTIFRNYIHFHLPAKPYDASRLILDCVNEICQ